MSSVPEQKEYTFHFQLINKDFENEDNAIQQEIQHMYFERLEYDIASQLKTSQDLEDFRCGNTDTFSLIESESVNNLDKIQEFYNE